MRFKLLSLILNQKRLKSVLSFKIKSEMHVLPEPFAMFACAGVWQPVSWDNARSKLAHCYKLYTFLSIVLIYSLTISELMGAILLTKNLLDFTDISFLLVSTLSVCCKTANIILKRQRIIGLADMMLDSKCVPRNARESEILQGFHRIARLTALWCLVLAQLTIVSMSATPLFQPSENRTLPFKSWLPFEVSTPALYWLSYAHQVVAIAACATINVANDSMICGFMVLACSQLELLGHRLFLLPETVKMQALKSNDKVRRSESKIIVECVEHHNHIFRFTDDINSIFSQVILVQFCMSSVVLSVSIYQLSVISSNGMELVMMGLYLCCMIVEFFIYCWFGNEVILKSTEFGQAIYDMDWTSIHVENVKNLIIMMIRSRRPIVMSCGVMVTLSIKSFTTIIKASYSAFNVLQRSHAEY